MKSHIVVILTSLLIAGCGAQSPKPDAVGKDSSHPAITSQKDLPSMVGKRIFVQGIAENHKYSAFVAGAGVYVWDKPGWPDSVVGKEVLVRGDLSIIDDRVETQDAKGEIRQTSNSILYVLKNTKWDLAAPKK